MSSGWFAGWLSSVGSFAQKKYDNSDKGIYTCVKLQPIYLHKFPAAAIKFEYLTIAFNEERRKCGTDCDPTQRF